MSAMAIDAPLTPPVPDNQASTKRPRRRRVVLVVGILWALFVIALIAVVVHGHTSPATVDPNLQAGSKPGKEQIALANVAAASAASAAVLQASSDGVPLSALSTSLLGTQLSEVTWAGALSESAYTKTGKRMVAIGVQNGHVITAVQLFPGQCSFGLVVTSPSDPIIAADHLGGPGVFGSTAGSATTRCGVASAPNRWVPVKPQSLASLSLLNR
jgi:hypothetical protein